MKTKPLPPLPPELRRAINKRAHSLAMVAEIAIRDRLMAHAAEQAEPRDEMYGLRPYSLDELPTLTEADMLTMSFSLGDLPVMSVDELLAVAQPTE